MPTNTASVLRGETRHGFVREAFVLSIASMCFWTSEFDGCRGSSGQDPASKLIASRHGDAIFARMAPAG
jgi:hypothetical protein